jgi:hypothetical protein
MISGFSKAFTQFQGKLFKILWRGSLTVIVDMKGNIFGGISQEDPIMMENSRRRLSGIPRQKTDQIECVNPDQGNHSIGYITEIFSRPLQILPKIPFIFRYAPKGTTARTLGTLIRGLGGRHALIPPAMQQPPNKNLNHIKKQNNT